MADPLPETRWCPGASWSRGGQAAQSKGHGQGLCQWTGLSSSSAETRGFVSLCKSEKGAAGCVYICQLFVCCGRLPTTSLSGVVSSPSGVPADQRGRAPSPGGTASLPEIGPLPREPLGDKPWRGCPLPFWLRTCSKTDTHNFSAHYQPNDIVIWSLEMRRNRLFLVINVSDGP